MTGPPPRRSGGDADSARLRRLPDIVTGLRFALLPVLWALALSGNSRALGALLVVAWGTDALDGYLARRLRTNSTTGARLDTIGDILLLGSTLAWIALLEPNLLREQVIALGIVVILTAVVLMYGWIKFRRLANLHLYSSKAAVLLAAVFTIHLFLVEGYSRPLFFLAFAATVVSYLEMLAVMVRRDAVDEHIGSLLRSPKRGG